MSTTVYYSGTSPSFQIGLFKAVFPGGATTQILDTFPTGWNPEDLAVTTTKLYYDTEQDSNNPGHSYVGVVNIDGTGNTILATITSSDLRDITLTPDGTSLLVCDAGNSAILSVNLSTNAVTTLSTAVTHPFGIIFDDNGRLFTFSTAGNLSGPTTLHQLDPSTGAILASSATVAGFFADGLTYDRVTGLLWAVWNQGTGSALINTGIQAFNPATCQLSGSQFVNASASRFDSISTGGDGVLWVGDYLGNAIYNVTANQTNWVNQYTTGGNVDGLRIYLAPLPPALLISCGNPPSGTVGVPYSASPSASGGTPPYTFSLTSGSMPPGLTMNTSTAAISGIPRLAGTYPFTLLVTDSASATASVNCSITIGIPSGSGGGSVGPSTAFTLKKLSLAMKKDPKLPVRGAN